MWTKFGSNMLKAQLFTAKNETWLDPKALMHKIPGKILQTELAVLCRLQNEVYYVC